MSKKSMKFMPLADVTHSLTVWVRHKRRKEPLAIRYQPTADFSKYPPDALVRIRSRKVNFLGEMQR
jgi:hypothetical protein